MVAITAGTDVRRDVRPAVGVVVGVVEIAAPGRAPAARMAAGSVADLDVAGQGSVREPVAGAAVQGGHEVVAVGVLGGDVGDHVRPVGGDPIVGDELVEVRRG
jgi:hypothetical protein